jgi:hypothetical protein
MSPRWIIRLIPLEIFILAIIVGWYLVSTTKGAAKSWAWPLPKPSHNQQPHSALILSPIFTPEVQHWSEKIAGWAEAVQLDSNLVATVMQIESCGWANAESSSGAQGLFQVMPWHFETGDDMLDPDTNAERGLAYLALGLQRANGDAGLALAGYNGGHGLIGRDSSLWPAETRRYFYWGTGIYAEATSGEMPGARLQEWLNAGGASLCEKAAEALGLN